MQQTAISDGRSSKIFWRIAPYIFVLFWAGGYTFAKLGLEFIEPLTMLSVRYGIAVVVLLPFLLMPSVRWPKTKEHWAAVAVTGFLIQVMYFGLAYLALKRGMNAGTMAIFMALQPIIVGALSPYFAGRSGGWILWLGLVLGFLGVVVVILSGDGLGSSPMVASILTLCALAGIVTATLFEKWHGKRTDPFVGGVVQYMVGFAVLMPIALSFESQTIVWHNNLIISLAYLVIANSIISISLFVALVQRGDATRISSLLYLVPPLALFLAWAVLGEHVSILTFVGFGLCVLGVLLVNRATE